VNLQGAQIGRAFRRPLNRQETHDEYQTTDDAAGRVDGQRRTRRRGCGERSAEKVGEKIDRTTSQVAAKTEAAADKATAKMGDAAITGSVKTALIAEPGLKALQIDSTP
jgi:hypothetical protein